MWKTCLTCATVSPEKGPCEIYFNVNFRSESYNSQTKRDSSTRPLLAVSILLRVNSRLKIIALGILPIDALKKLCWILPWPNRTRNRRRDQRRGRRLKHVVRRFYSCTCRHVSVRYWRGGMRMHVATRGKWPGNDEWNASSHARHDETAQSDGWNAYSGATSSNRQSCPPYLAPSSSYIKR